MKVPITLVQFEDIAKRPFEKVKGRVEEYIQEAKEHSSQIICFPEYFWHTLSDYDSPDQYEFLATIQSTKILATMRELAKKYDINVISGTLMELRQGKYFNTCNVINNKGKIVYKYAKRKPVPFGFEYCTMSKGEKKSKVITIAGLKVGIIICRELFYPEYIKSLRKQGAEIIFVPSYWPKKSNDYQRVHLLNRYNVISEMKVVDVLTQARSFENEICICYVNASGNKKQGELFDVLLGRTQVCYPFLGCVHKIAQNKEGTIHFEYDSSIISDARKAYELDK